MCQEGAEVVLYKIEDGGHTWPGAEDGLPSLGRRLKTSMPMS